MADQVMTGRFVGRAEELALLGELLARATVGEPLVALVGREAEVGKTRLVERLAASASGQGVRVLRGGCVPLGEDGLPFAPVIQARRGLAGDLDQAELEAVAGPARADLARLVPGLAWGGEVAAAAAWERLRQPYRVAYAGFRQAEALLAGTGDRDAAGTALHRAADITGRLGARLLDGEVKALAQRARLHLGPPATATAAAGTPAPADQLGVANRVEAAAVAHRLGLDRD